MSSKGRARWDDVKAAFQRAIELAPAERDAFLSRACDHDPALRAEVDALLAVHDDERPFLSQSPIPGAVHELARVLDDTEPVSAALPPGSRIGHYQLAECLGAGGMGEVYRAHDTRLDRFVALKILHDSAGGRSAARVLREARAASALSHPNICTVYDVGEAERPYLAMEYVAGQPLDTMIPAEGLSAADVLRYGAQMADALDHAHERGVIHRDLKAANVVITPDGRAKVLDFGIARRAASAGAAPVSGTVTHAGTVAGTPAYMAPELLRDRQADARSDIWALGVVLYEMASGRRPFEGASPFEVTSAILNSAPAPLPRTVPAVLRSAIEHCLARNPDERFQRAADVAAALRQEQPVTFRAPRPRVRRRALAGVFAAAALIVFTLLAFRANRPADGTSLAVLRFRVLSAAPEFAFLGIGVPDTITSRLAVVNGMRVRALLSSQKDEGEPQAVGRELGVDYVLTGTIQQGQDEIRITPQLVRVADGVSVWSRAYTRRSIDLLALQDEIARGLAAALPLDLTAEDRARMDRQYTRNPDAHALYVRGRAELVRNDSTATLAAIEAFEAALARDQDYVLAYAGLAVASAKMRLFFALEPDVATWQARAHQAAQRALQLNPDVAETREALAAVYRSTEFNWAGTLDESAQALRHNPNLDLPHLYRASAFSHLGLFDRVESEARAAQENNPANIDEPLRVRGVSAMFAGRFDEAVTLLEQARRASGRATEWNLAYAYYYVGRKAEAEATLRMLAGSARSQRRAQATLASFLAARGEAGLARGLIKVVRAGSYQEHHVAYALGVAHAQLGMPAEALQWLREARSTGFECYPWFERDPLLSPLKPYAAFRQFLGEFKQSWETARAQYH